MAREYAARGVTIDPERIVLTASSSEAYGFLFKLLCDPGDTVLVPTPSYPLFEHLASLDGVHVVPFPLDPAHGWQPPAPEIRPATDARAAILVHPNNPTGSWVGTGRRRAARGMRGHGRSRSSSTRSSSTSRSRRAQARRRSRRDRPG